VGFHLSVAVRRTKYGTTDGERGARREPMQQRMPRSGQKSRREQVEGTLKQLEARQKASKRIPLSMRLSQAGLSWTRAALW
jgi:tight adherence protein B